MRNRTAYIRKDCWVFDVLIYSFIFLLSFTVFSFFFFGGGGVGGDPVCEVGAQIVVPPPKLHFLIQP